MSKYEEITNEDSIYLELDEEGEAGAYLACCDCGLVHLFIIGVGMNEKQELHIKLQVHRNERSTAQLRRHNSGALQRGECQMWEMIRRSV